MIGENDRYGIYVDTDGPFALAGNTICANRTGVMLKGTPRTRPERQLASSATTEMDVKNG